jgi:hypothetical protein
MKEQIVAMLKENFPNLSEQEITLIGIFSAKAEKHYRTLYAKRIVEALFKPDKEAAYKEALITALVIIIRMISEDSHPEDYEWACTTYKNITGLEPEELFK